MSDEVNTTNKSEFNSAFKDLDRIGETLLALSRAHYRKDYESLFNILRIFYLELSSMIGDKQTIAMDEKVESLTNTLYAIRELKRKNKPIPDEYYNEFWKFDRDLRRLRQKAGMGMAEGADRRFSLAN